MFRAVDVVVEEEAAEDSYKIMATEITNQITNQITDQIRTSRVVFAAEKVMRMIDAFFRILN